MSKNIKIDELFRERLEDYASPTPMDLWDSIETQLPENTDVRKSRPLWFFMSIAILLLGLFGFSEYWTSEKSPNPATEILQINNIKSQEDRQSDQEQVLAQADQLVGKKYFSKNSTDEATKSENKASSINKAKLESVSSLDNKSLLEENNTTKTSNKTKKYNSADLLTQQTGSKTKLNAITENSKNLKKNLNLTPVSERRQESSLDNGRAQLKEKKSKDFVFDSSLKENSIQLPVVSLFKKPVEVKSLTFPNLKSRCPSGFKLLPKPKFTLDALVGFDYAHRLLDARSSSAQSYITIREETENYASSHSFGSRFSIAYASGFVWRIGLIYNKLNEKISLVGLEGYGHIEDVSTLEKDNIYQFVDVPILFGYETSNNKMTWGFNAGTFVNLSFKSPDNFIIGPDRDKIILNPDDPSNEEGTPIIFKGPIGISLYGSLNASYDLSDRVSLIAEPYLRVIPQSITVDDYPLEQRYVNMGIMTGLRIKL